MANQLEITFHDGTTAIVQTTIEDRLNFETTLRKNKGWGALQDNAIRMQLFLAWSAAQRLGATDLTWLEFSSGDTAVIDVAPYEPEPDPDDEDPDDEDLEVDGLGEGIPTGASTTSPSDSDSDSA